MEVVPPEVFDLVQSMGKKMHLAPVALFTYKRLDHTRRTIDALQRNELAEHSRLFVFSDGPRKEGDKEQVVAVREYLRSVSGFRSIAIIERDQNLGLARSIISGVTDVVSQYGRIIVLEDDMVTSPYFLRYMNESLDLYEHDERVISIHGYIYPVRGKLPETFFLRGADCWGWATWMRGWELFEPDGQKLLDRLQAGKLCHRFNFDGTYPYIKMLMDQISGDNDSWAIRWYASAFLSDRLTLFPGKSLLSNIGFDDSGAHCPQTSVFDTDVASVPIRVERIPLQEDLTSRNEIKKYFRLLRKGLLRRVKIRLVELVGGIGQRRQ